MNPKLNEVIQQVAFGFPGIELYLDSKWASTYSDHRLKIRKHLFKKTKVKSVLDLNNRPQLHNQYVSISHCPVMGGFVLSPHVIGIDLEQKKRLSPSVIKRIATSSELALFPAPTLQAIWTIKESVFKCAGVAEFNIADVEIQSLHQNSPALDLKTQNPFKSHENSYSTSSYLKTISQFQGQLYSTLTWISDEEDLSLSLSNLKVEI